MTRFVLVRVGISLIAVAAIYGLAALIQCGSSTEASCLPGDAFVEFFASNIRASLFAGFLSLGGFLLSLMTFIVVNIKKDVYDSEKYGEIFAAQSKLPGKAARRYDPLRDLATVLFVAIFSSILCAIFQLTIGLIASIWAALICLWSAMFAAAMLVSSLFLIRANLHTWFEHLGD